MLPEAEAGTGRSCGQGRWLGRGVFESLRSQVPTMAELQPTDNWLLPKSRLDDLLGLLAEDGYEVIGPRVEQGAIVYGPIQSSRDLPIGWTDRQAPGSYRLEKRADDAYFGYAVGPHSWKKYLFPPTLRLWQAERTRRRRRVPRP